jgi:hypothetical protein
MVQLYLETASDGCGNNTRKQKTSGTKPEDFRTMPHPSGGISHNGVDLTGLLMYAAPFGRRVSKLQQVPKIVSSGLIANRTAGFDFTLQTGPDISRDGKIAAALLEDCSLATMTRSHRVGISNGLIARSRPTRNQIIG